MVNEKEFKKQIRSAYKEERGRPGTRKYLLILVAAVLVLVLFVIVMWGVGPLEQEAARQNMQALVQDSKNIVAALRGIG